MGYGIANNFSGKIMEDLQEQVQSWSMELEKIKQWREISVKYQKR